MRDILVVEHADHADSAVSYETVYSFTLHDESAMQ